MKQKSCCAGNVCCSDWFLSISPDTRALYFQLQFEGDNCGRLVGFDRLVRAYCGDSSQVSELEEAGLLARTADGVFIRHWFEHNGAGSNGSMKNRILAEYDGFTEPLAFEGEPFCSAYRLNSENEGIDYVSPTGSLSVDYASTRNSNSKGKSKSKSKSKGKGNAKETEQESEEEEKEQSTAFSIETAACPECGAFSPVAFNSLGKRYITCPECEYNGPPVGGSIE